MLAKRKPEQTNKSIKAMEPSPVPHQKIQTAEGWKRNNLLKIQGKQSKTK
jgi:hypothetical protein